MSPCFINQEFYISPKEYLCVSYDYPSGQRQMIVVCNGEALRFLCGTDCVFKYYLDDFLLRAGLGTILAEKRFLPLPRIETLITFLSFRFSK